MTLIQHLLLVMSVAALAAAAVRLASTVVESGLARVLVATVAGAATAVLEALLLGLVGLAGTPAALGGLAVATWVAARSFLPAPALAVRTELAHWWVGQDAWTRLTVGGLAGATLSWSAWLLYRPIYGTDSIRYHTAEIVLWMQSGKTGAAERVFHGQGVEYYPLVNEVLGAWGVGLAQSFVPLALLTPAFLALLVTSGWVGLRTLGVSRAVAALAIAALSSVPVLTKFFYESHNDMPALAWLLCAGALSAQCARRPAAIAPAVVAIGLAIGTKTTVVPLAAILLAWTLLQNRAFLRSHVRALLAATVVLALVGLFWYVRNLIAHGSPFWPLSPSPWGDPAPFPVSERTTSFIERPQATVRAHLGDFRFWLAGGFLLLSGGVMVGVLRVSRAVRCVSAVTVLAAVAYSFAPSTGLTYDPTRDLSLQSLRYVMPAVGAAVLGLALATREAGIASRLAKGILAAALIWNLVEGLGSDPGSLSIPTLSPQALVLGLAGGALVAFGLGRLSGRSRLELTATTRVLSVAFLLLVAGAVLAVSSSGYVERLAVDTQHGQGVIRWMTANSQFADTRRPISASPVPLGLLAGDHLEHDLSTLPARASCAQVRRRLEREWIIVARRADPVTPAAACLIERHRPVFTDKLYVVYGSDATTASRPKPTGTD